MKHPIEKAAEIAGSEKALADWFGVTKAAVWQWKQEGRWTPIEHCPEIERRTGGAVTRRDLRPNDWQQIWPELVAQSKPTQELAQPSTSTKEAGHD